MRSLEPPYSLNTVLLKVTCHVVRQKHVPGLSGAVGGHRPAEDRVGLVTRGQGPLITLYVSLYYSTFSRTVCRLYGGAKGLVMLYCLPSSRRRRGRAS